MNRLFAVACFALLMFAAGSASAQTRIYVNQGAVGGTGACATPFGTVAEGLNLARTSGGVTEIRITGGPIPGTQYPEQNLTIDFSNVALKGGYDPASFAGACTAVTTEAARNTTNFTTIIDANQTDRIFDILPVRIDTDGDTIPDAFQAVNTGITFDAITFRDGQPNRQVTPTLTGGSGGAMLILNCDVAITNCVFQNNTTKGEFFGGGAIYLAGYFVTVGLSNSAHLTLADNRFLDNHTGVAAGNGSGPGGAIYAADFNLDNQTGAGTRLTIIDATRNTFMGNVSNGSGPLNRADWCPEADAGVDENGDTDPTNDQLNQDCSTTVTGPDACISRAVGGAVFLADVNGTWEANTFESNVSRGLTAAQADSTGQGGAMAIFCVNAPYEGAPSITNNVFRTNIADGGAGSVANGGCGYSSAWGGALYLAYFNDTLSGNTFDSNIANGINTPANPRPNVAWGGAILGFGQGSLVVDNNQFLNNRANGGTGRSTGRGGGASILEGRYALEPTITNNVFRGNACTGNTAGSAYGGGLLIQSTQAYVVVAKNLFEQNTATGIAGAFSGMGGGVRLELSNNIALFADNVVRQNNSSNINARLGFAGVVVFTGQLNDTAKAPRLQNNLIVENNGIGLGLVGFPYDADGDGSITDPDEYVFCSPDLINNTISANLLPGMTMNMSDNMLVDSTIIYGNDQSGSGIGDIDDEFLTNSRESRNLRIRYSDFGSRPTTLDALYTIPANRNFEPPQDPRFATGFQGDYYLRQPPDTPAPHSAMVDAGPVTSGARDFGANINYTDIMANRTTRPLDQTSDLCFVDIGFHYQLPALAIDSDGDLLPDADEVTIGTNPNDADSDDDGVPDGSDCGTDLDGDGSIAALDCDADGDGITDGTERGITAPTPGTNAAATCNTSNACCGSASQPAFQADLRPATTTDPLNPDSDAGGEQDGCEDPNHNGRVDATERNPSLIDDDDADRDGLPSGIETGFLGTDPLDSDSDDDGISDNDELNNIPATEPLLCDTDGDTLPDGLEAGVTTPLLPAPCAQATDVTATCASTGTNSYVADTDPTTTTDPTNPDSDGDGMTDSTEDVNQNGAVDAPETDPNVPDVVSIELRENESITNLLLPVVGACGQNTVPRMITLMTTGCAVEDCARFSINQTFSTTITPATPLTRAGKAAPRSGPAHGATGLGALILYQHAGCATTLRVTKTGTDLVLLTQ